MAEFQYMNYDTVNKRLSDLINNENSKIKLKKESPVGLSNYLIPIDHYTLGSGAKHIIVTASYHSAEIITTSFVVRLMEDLSLNPGDFNPEEYTIDFFPIINPEGYIITTEMQDLYLEQGKTEEEKIALAKEYWKVNRQDAINTLNANKILKNSESLEIEKQKAVETLRGKKGYQALYDNIDQEKFLSKYPHLKESVMGILKKYNYPIGVCASWTANGNGVDLSQNVPFNSLIDQYKKDGPSYSGAAYSNIRKDAPGPFNCPCQDLNNFSFESENLHLLNFLCMLNAEQDKEISAFINYHSVMGKIYQRPVQEQEMLDLYHIDYFQKLTENYVGARTMREENAYDIISGEDPYNYINEYYRLRFGINIQPELSRMGGNPIGPLSDVETFENVTVKPNLKAFRNFVGNLNFIKDYSKFINSLVTDFNKERTRKSESPLDAKEVYSIIDNICQKNPSLYTKLRDEINKSGAYNAHVISYLFSLVEGQILNKNSLDETISIKENFDNKLNSEENFVKNYSDFLNKIVERLNKDREKRNLEPLSTDQINSMIDNICLDYPELFAKLKQSLSSEIYDERVVDVIYGHLGTIIDNQIRMGNLIK